MTDFEMFWIQNAKGLTDISAVAGFKNIKRLYFENCGTVDLSPVAGLTTLEEVSLRGSDISDISPLADIYPNLEDKDFELN